MISETTPKQQQIPDNLEQLLQALPPDVLQAIEAQPDQEDLLEIVLDLGRPPEARFPGRVLYLTERLVDASDIDYVTARVGEFGKDNRAGIERTLHRISAIRNRSGRVVGLTCRIGRAVFGTIDIMRDVVETGKSILMLGRPGVGKTTKCREVARVLSEEFSKRVVIVDTSNEIAGDGDIPHPAIGRARRMQVPAPELQHAVMIEAVENHMPEVIVIDEIGTEAEALAARTIAERGVQLIATAHGKTLDNLLMNPTLSDLLGGIHAVTLSDEEARRRGTQKTVLERKAPPTFDTLVEIRNREEFSIYHDTVSVVDAFLRGRSTRPEVRIRKAEGFEVVEEVVPPVLTAAAPADEPRKKRVRERGVEEPATGRKTVRIYPYGVSKDRLMRAINDLQVSATIAKTPKDADVVLTLKAHEKRQPRTLKDLEDHGLEVAIIRSNTVSQMKSFLMGTFGLQDQKGEEETAMTEVAEALDRVMSYGKPVELAPQSAHIRRLQHQLIEQHGLGSESRGEVPWRRVIVLPTRG